MRNPLEIISFSFDKKTIEQIEKLGKKLNLKSKSKLLRLAIDSLRKEILSLDNLNGNKSAVVVIVYNKHNESDVGELAERFDSIIKTDIHQHSGGVCSRILLVYGDVKKIKKMVDEFKIKKSVRSATVNVL